MAGDTNLRALFLQNAGSTVSAQHIFTNRILEIEAFRRAVISHRSDLQIGPGRRNVLMFYGVGGIGKTTLSVELQRRSNAGEGVPNANTVRVDFADEMARDPEAYLLQIRAALNSQYPRMLAFDLAFANYWARAHPGEPLQDYLERSSRTSRISDSLSLGEQIHENLSLLAGTELGGLPGLAQKASLELFRSIRDQVGKKKVLAECPHIDDLLDAEPSKESLSFFAHLLQWDIGQHWDQGDIPLVIFLDTAEAVFGSPHRPVERLIQRLVYLFPSALFVITGRNRLDWAELTVNDELDFVGPTRWPLLPFGKDHHEPRQHLVGYLSSTDADSYLRRALTLDGTAAIGDEIRHAIVDSAKGHPLHLDLSVTRFVDLTARGVMPAAADFVGSFQSLVTRTMRDLEPDERDLLRSACLTTLFDSALLRAALPKVRDGVIERFLRRPFLERDQDRPLAFSVHDTLREAISNADGATIGGWSNAEYRKVAERIGLHFGGVCADANISIEYLTVATRETLRLAIRYGFFQQWLLDAADTLIDRGLWSAVAVTPDQGEASDENALASALSAVKMRRQGDLQGSADLLAAVGKMPSLDHELRSFVSLHLAHVYRNLGRYQDAAGLYESIESPRYASETRYWLADYAYLRGRFQDALEELHQLAGGLVGFELERLRLLGHIYRLNADFARALESYTTASVLAKMNGHTAAYAKAQTNIVEANCWVNPAYVVEEFEAVEELHEMVQNRVEIVKVRAAAAIAHARLANMQAAETLLTSVRSLGADLGYVGALHLSDTVEALLAAGANNRQRFVEASTRLHTHTDRFGGNFAWTVISNQWVPEDWRVPPSPAALAAQWLQGTRALEVWATVVP